jgi:hypothetical protein
VAASSSIQVNNLPNATENILVEGLTSGQLRATDASGTGDTPVDRRGPKQQRDRPNPEFKLLHGRDSQGNLLEKLELHTVPELILYAVRKGIIA